ncbi:MAG: amylo-alpha-1,6-glucosidase [Firmicutes bacterium]|nr:amylo-alpha-1,6-glucosidase [Bacillota bacterium]
MDQVKNNNLNSYLPGHNEWVLGNGIGGYSSLSSTSECERKHHALLVASKLPPTNRKVLLQNILERVEFGGNTIPFICPDSTESKSNGILMEFSTYWFPRYLYTHDLFLTTKEISTYYGHNTVAIVYEFHPLIDLKLILTPLFNNRSHSEVSTQDSLIFKSELNKRHLILSSGNEVIHFKISEGEFVQKESPISPEIRFEKDEATGDNRVDYAYQPYDIEIQFTKGKKKRIEIVCSDQQVHKLSARRIIDETSLRRISLVHEASLKSNDQILNQAIPKLILSSDDFVCYRESTKAMTVLAGFPWFTDWGRDTMISFEGLLLVTKRYKEALEVLKSFAKYEKNGLIPNMFPDHGSAPFYNTVDASLWYIHAIYQYYMYTSDLSSVEELFYPVMESIIKHYKSGTDNFIFMDKDGLIHAGSGLDQVTWMDVRINGEVITPRHGKPVEINALWYNALQIMNHFESLKPSPNLEYTTLAILVKKSFKSKFWNSTLKCLYDVVDPLDPSIRPNQIYAISLPFSMLEKSQSEQILKVVKEELLDVYGIRTLSINNPKFMKEYSGDIVHRDHAYHMGTSWGFLMGTYLYAVLHLHNFSENAVKEVTDKLRQVLNTLDEGCINSIAEVFDGLDGFGSKGCFAQAWSVAEILRVLAELSKEESHENR